MPYLDRKRGAWEDLHVVHVPLNVLGALDGPPDRVVACRLPSREATIYRWPHDDHGITDKLDNVASILVQVRNHALHVAINAERKFFVTSGAFLSTRFR